VPYIENEERPVYQKSLDKIAVDILSVEDGFLRTEMLAWSIGTLFRKMKGNYDSYDASFNCLKFDGDHRNSIREEVHNIESIISKQDLANWAGHINYCCSYLIWNIHKEAKYAHRAYLREMLFMIKDSINHAGTNTADLRRLTLMKGVLRDIDTENYRRNTASYENKKALENGDVITR